MENVDPNEKFDECKKRLRDETDRIWSGWSHKGPLYHYTDGPGLTGILSSKTLWATSALCLNDPLEIAYGVNVARAVDADMGRFPFFSGEKALRDIKWWRQHIAGSMYVACFCADGDKLSQWRYYADKGRGYAIEFDYESLLEHGAKQGDYALIRMLYEVQRQRHVIRQQFKSAYEICFGSGAQTPSARAVIEAAMDTLTAVGLDMPTRLEPEVLMELLKSFCRLKHPKFKEEEEVRLLRVITEPGLDRVKKRRLSGNNLIEYVEQPFPLGAVRKIVLGPCGGQSARKSAVLTLLKDNRLGHVKISRSRIPLRG
jgi:hypothetical protein